MVRAIVVSSLKLRRLVLAAALGLIVFGVVQIRTTPVDALPELGPPTVAVQTEALGLSAAEVEQLITSPLEQDLLVGVAFLDEIESVSLPGLSSVMMTFEPGTDPLDARQVVQERLTQAVGIAGLPAVAKLPQMIQPLSTSSRVAMAKLSSHELTPIEMSVLARWVIGPRLLGVDGVANVSIWGNRDRQLQVRVDPDRLARNGVRLSQVIRTSGNALEVSPLSYLEASAPGTGGFIDTPNQRLNIFHEQAIQSAAQLAEVPLEGPSGERLLLDGKPVLLGDVTDVVEDHQPLIGDTACSKGEQCLIVVLEQFPGANTAEVAQGIEKAFAALAPGLSDMRIDSSVYRPAAYVDAAVDGVGLALAIGGGLLLLVLLVTSGWRRTVVIAVTMGASAGLALTVLRARDADVNMLVVAGLVLGLTALVHDSVNDAEAIGARLRERREAGAHNQVVLAVQDAASGARRSVVYGVLMMAAAALPLLFLQGAAGAFLPDIVASYLLAVGASMVAATVVLPVMAATLLTHERETSWGARTGARLRAGYAHLAARTLARPRMALAALAAMSVVTLAVLPLASWSMRPELRERDLLVSLKATPGAALPQVSADVERLVADLERVDGVAHANATVGRAVMSDQTVNVHEGQVWVAMTEGADYDRTFAAVKRTASDHDAFTATVGTYTDARVRNVLDRAGGDLRVRIYGTDQAALDAKATEFVAGIGEIDGVTRARMDTVPDEEAIEVHVDLARAQAHGIKPGDVRRAAAALLGGITVGNLFEEQKVFDVVVWGAPQVRESVDDLRALLIDAPDGRRVRLGDVAEVVTGRQPAVIPHESVQRYTEVAVDVDGRSVADVAADVDALIAGTTFPLDHHAEVVDDFRQQQDDRRLALTMVLTALVAGLLLLQAGFGTWRMAGLGLAALAASVSGGLLMALALDGEIALGAAAGLVVGLGLAARFLVALLGQYRMLRLWGHSVLDVPMVTSATGASVPAIVVTSLGSVAMLAPMAVLGRQAGTELLAPAALVLVGVLLTTVPVMVLLVPALYLRFGTVQVDDVWAQEPPAPIAHERSTEAPSGHAEPAGSAP